MQNKIHYDDCSAFFILKSTAIRADIEFQQGFYMEYCNKTY